MKTLIALVCAIGIGIGVLLIIKEFTRTPETGTTPRPISTHISGLRTRLKTGRTGYLLGGIVLGVLLFARTGWFSLLIAAPLGAILIPPLFTNAAQKREIEKLEALQTWTRALAGLMGTGSSSLTAAVTTSLINAPEVIRPELNNLVSRLNNRWSPKRAYKAFAAELNDPTADLVAIHLILASSMKAAGLSETLTDLAELIFDEVRQRREIDASRETNRTTARIVTLVTLATILIACLMGNSYFSTYATPLGQLILALILLAYGLALRWMHSLSKPVPVPRLLVTTQGATS